MAFAVLSYGAMRASLASLAAAAAVFVVQLTGSCERDRDGASTSSPMAQGLGASSVRYRTRWDWGRAVPDEHGFRVVSDRGITVHVERGYVTAHGLALVPCRMPRAALGLSLAVPMAHAGHDGVRDASAAPPRVESLAAPATTDEVIALPSTRYCQLHYLVARADRHTRALPGDVPMDRVSVHLEGTYQLPGARDARPFSIHSAMAHGVLLELDPRAPSRTGALEVVLTRRLDTLFDGLEFESASDVQRASAILTNLMAGARLERTRSSDG